MERQTQRPLILAIAGLMGAGKTTLARQLCDVFGWSYVPKERVAPEYLADLFESPSRFAFEAQLAMFCSKAREVSKNLAEGKNVVVDRSLDEDIGVFARHFRELGHIDERAYRTYELVTRYILQQIGPTDLTVYCDVNTDTAAGRIYSRARGEERLYPQGHLQNIASYYKDWLDSYMLSPVWLLDSNLADWRTPAVARQIAVEIRDVIENVSNSIPADVPSKREARLMVPYREIQNWRTAIPLSSGPSPKMSKGSIYLAAPFTAAEERRPIPADNTQNTDPAETHGRIPPGPYRSALIEAASAMRRLGFSVTLPHKDVNDWGEKKLLPEEVMRTCTQQVSVCDLFVGILAQSCGSHYEFGLALGLGKPCLIIAPDELSHSFLAQGSRAIDAVPQAGRGELMVQSVKTVFDIPSLFDREEVKEFLVRAVARLNWRFFP